MRVLVEGPDKVGKTTFVKSMAAEANVEAKFLPDGAFRPLLLNGDVTGTASTFMFFANTMEYWQNPDNEVLIDRDIVSMLVYQGYLLKNMDPLIIINLYKSIVYKVNQPDKIIYLTNEPFEEYDADDFFEAFGYEKIREAYDEAIRVVELNFPDIEIVHMSADDDR